MNKRILVGVDMEMSPPTQQALRAVSEFLEPSSPYLYVILLTVIPVPYATSPSLGRYREPLSRFGSTRQERLQADRVLQSACDTLTQQGITPTRIELLRREGAPADEIVKVAQELHVDCIVIGSHENSLGQKIRRLLIGSTSRQVLQQASCPVMIVALPQMLPHNLVAWYEAAITRHLHEQNGTLTIFTPREVAQRFAPSHGKTGHKEIAAAARAMEQLASHGVLCCQIVKGELRCVND
jgi:nucleotide-binding universal stress UspA family protein